MILVNQVYLIFKHVHFLVDSSVSFLHQTTTSRRRFKRRLCCISFLFYIKPQPRTVAIVRTLGCISFLFYIKPQPFRYCVMQPIVVYLFFSTSNHNYKLFLAQAHQVVYLFFSTSNHNYSRCKYRLLTLYIFSFLHQTTTIFSRLFL